MDLDLGRPALARDLLENSLERVLRSGESQTIVPHLAQLLRACAALDDAPAAQETARRLIEHMVSATFFDWTGAVPTLLAARWLLTHPQQSPPEVVQVPTTFEL